MRTTLAIACTLLALFAPGARAQTAEGPDVLTPEAREILVWTLRLDEKQVAQLGELETAANTQRAAIIQTYLEDLAEPGDFDVDEEIARTNRIQVQMMQRTFDHAEDLRENTRLLLDDVELILREEQRRHMESARLRVQRRPAFDQYSATLASLRADPALVAHALDLRSRLEADASETLEDRLHTYDRAVSEHIEADHAAQAEFIDSLDPDRGVTPGAFETYLETITENLVDLQRAHTEHSDVIARALPEPLRLEWRRQVRRVAYPWIQERTEAERALGRILASSPLGDQADDAVERLADDLDGRIERLREEWVTAWREAEASLTPNDFFSGMGPRDSEAITRIRERISTASASALRRLRVLVPEEHHDLIAPPDAGTDDVPR